MAGIVVGIDGSENSIRALHWAAAEARLRDVPLRVVTAWSAPALVYDARTSASLEEEVIASQSALADRRLDEACGQESAALKGLAVERRIVGGAAAPVLIDQAKDADLLVIGSRGHGGFAGLLLGSVSQQCAHHSLCPVVVVPPPPNGSR
jgi:nucleotide-binding universal stress UspA family protein